MKKYYFILFRLFRINYKSLKSVTNLSVILSTLLCVVFVSITLSITDGFKENVISKIIFFDGYARVDYHDLTTEDLGYLRNHSEYNVGIQPYYESEYIIKNSHGSELVTLFSSNQIKKKISNINILSNDSVQNKVYVGYNLKNKLFSNNNDLTAILISENKPFETVNAVGFFETGVPLFDNHVVISNIIDLDFYSNVPSGYIINKQAFEKIDYSLSTPIYTYKDRYYDFLKWLDSYDLPIFILLFFIVIVGLINNKFCYTVDILNRRVDSSIFHNLGLSYKEIYYLYWYKFLLLNSIGILLGTMVSLFLLYLETHFHFIQIPSEIYFTSSIPITFKLYNFMYLPLIILLQTFYFSLFKYEIK